jgi:multidrug efflux pump subunit AcrB
MTVTVRADVKDGVQAPDVSERLWPKLDDIRAHLPVGYRVEMGGAIEESSKANASIAAAFPVVGLLMLTIGMFQLQNFARLGLVLMSAPLGLIGASLALNIFGAPFGFVALLGLIALSGMDMRNSIILVDQVRQDLEHGANYREAIIGATVRRARPVALTAMAAILAMIPLTRSAFLGTDGAHHHGRVVRCDLPDRAVLAGALALWFRRSLDKGLADVPAHGQRPEPHEGAHHVDEAVE